MRTTMVLLCCALLPAVGQAQTPIRTQPARTEPQPDTLLAAKITKLSEVVVVGYGTTDRKKLTGSVSTLKPNPTGAPPLTVEQMMIGRMAGVQITPSSGVPGSAVAITIRGLSTLSNNGNAPLVVVDGIPIYGIGQESNNVNYNPGSTPGFAFGGTSVVSGYTQGSNFEKNPLASINPDDIESIEVLKDAYATAIYGSRGAAGVILITTKKGKVGKTQINAQVSTSISKPFAVHDVMTGDEYADFYNAYYKAVNPNAPKVFPKGINTNWVDAITRKATGVSANVNMSGGTDKNSYYLSAGYDKMPSCIINNNYERYQGKVSADQQLGSYLKVGANIAVSHAKNSGAGAQALYREAVLRAPNLPIYNADGTYAWGNGANPTGPTEDLNPVAKARKNQNYSTDSRVLGLAFAELKLFPWLVARSEIGTDMVNSRSYSREASRPHQLTGLASETSTQNRKWVTNNTLTVNKTLGGVHTINAVLGQSFESSVENTSSVTGQGFLSDDILSISAASDRRVITAFEKKTALVSYFGRLNYQYMNKYLAGVTYRQDGSSRFSKNRRYVGFPSFSLGWVPSEEKFMKNLTFIDQLKFRGSVGFTGTDGGAGYYGNQGQYKLATYSATYGNMQTISVSQPANPNLKWERTNTFDVGMDLSLFNNRLSITADYYNRKTTDAILTSAVPSFMGFTIQQQNLADLNNRGWEISITSTNIEHRDFKWSSTVNISRNKNIIKKLHKIDPNSLAATIESNGGNFWLPGYSASEFFMYQWAGVDPKTGQPQWTDNTGKQLDKPIREVYPNEPDEHRKAMGDAMPSVYGGFGNNIIYKNFELDVFFSFAAGHKMYNGANAALYSYTSGSFSGDDVNNLSRDLLNYWKQTGDNTGVPMLVNNSNSAGSFFSKYDYTVGRNISRFLEDASFIKLRNITLAYNLSKGWMQRMGLGSITHARLFVQAENVFVITGYSGIDPEVSAYGSSGLKAGFDELTLPNPRIFRFGLKLGL
ncbi:SusC/RagA family TonB-linked outer membrane protein [Pseudoflavitalea sp. G-6-1-2]|uniref:SusC/RagA family TonB-linked outer membrane protein n=1 Tax=Pseudoflavitalea sp. G-6-1-2 TaxID=2728841 RepID=UPI00146F72E6|nr:SusC/RagA family TonB-linked outer membrane protein [Pseudoflavitalea sp. G-6-1-2]NML23906.1 SusC/RagA family TonB-linked outer membrane protein [Pseudoflavitalea sp. G-6-1-2]